jgi:catechol 2,3-dioxygenase-like lactoylglutathione lyase family enzyme
MAKATLDRKTQDVGNIVFLEHVNVTVPDQETATTFYVEGLGYTRDPYMMVSTNNMWVNVGQQQFHLPRGEPQRLRGYIGVIVPDLRELETRLQGVQKKLAGTQFAYKTLKDHIAITCPWGNQFRAHEKVDGFRGSRGIPYVELPVPAGTAAGIKSFYEEYMRAPCELKSGKNGHAAVQVCVGPGQRLIFRETASKLPAYDGHHIAVYVADFSGPHAHLKKHKLISQEDNEFQYRFQDITPPKAKQPLFTIEHEVRSLYHPLYRVPLVNRVGNERLP